MFKWEQQNPGFSGRLSQRSKDRTESQAADAVSAFTLTAHQMKILDFQHWLLTLAPDIIVHCKFSHYE